MGGYTMGDYMLPSQDHVANTSETLYPQETHLEEEDEDEDEDHAANDGENVEVVDEYEERIEQGDFENDVDDHEVVPNYSTNNPGLNPKKEGQFLKLSTPNKFLYFKPKSLNPTEPSIAGYGSKNVSHVFK